MNKPSTSSVPNWSAAAKSIKAERIFIQPYFIFPLIILSVGIIVKADGSFRNRIKPPDKLFQGCSPELLRSPSFHQFAAFCQTNPPLAIVAHEGVEDAMEECRSRMRFHAWDCSQPGTVLNEPSLLRYGYRETAYLLAMSAAGAAWGVATACAQGWLEECKCAQPEDFQFGQSEFSGSQPTTLLLPDDPTVIASNWDWSGCSYGAEYGITTSRKLFTRTKGQLRNPLGKMERHNLRAGRLAVKRTLLSQCKCHGVSGSCQQKTCWKKTADLTSITDQITEKYYRAKQWLNDGTKVRNSDLIYLESSPETCTPYTYERQQRRSLPRVCNWRNETHSMGDCNTLCCGRGYSIRHEPVTYKCDCKFVWCCNLQCNECLEHQWVSTCNN